MSRFLTHLENGEYLEEIDSIKVCKWLINEVCCNDSCEHLGDFPFPSKICYEDNVFKCECFEKEDGDLER